MVICKEARATAHPSPGLVPHRMTNTEENDRMTYDVPKMDASATIDLQHAFSNRTHALAPHTLEEAARVLNYGGSTDHADELASFTEARAQHPAYQHENRYAAIQVFRLRVQELLGVERDL